MKLYSAYVTDKETGERLVITREYPTLKDFKSDLWGNGYAISFACLDEKYDEASEKYNERRLLRNYVNRHIYASNKKSAERLGMTVKEYREWIKN